MKFFRLLPALLVVFCAMETRADLTVEVSGIATAKGTIRALLFAGPEGFPEVRAKALAEISVPASGAKDGALLLTFKKVNAGAGVVSVFHDLDDSGTIKKNLLGMPREPVGISNWSGLFAPTFAKCRAELASPVRIALRQP